MGAPREMDLKREQCTMQVLLLQLQARRVLLMLVPRGRCRMPFAPCHAQQQPWLPPACRGDGEAVKHFC